MHETSEEATNGTNTIALPPCSVPMSQKSQRGTSPSLLGFLSFPASRLIVPRCRTIVRQRGTIVRRRGTIVRHRGTNRHQVEVSEDDIGGRFILWSATDRIPQREALNVNYRKFIVNYRDLDRIKIYENLRTIHDNLRLHRVA